MTSASFAEYMGDITGRTLEAYSCEVRCFTHGDYTMLCDPQYKASMRNKKLKHVTGGSGSDTPADDCCSDGAFPWRLHACLTWWCGVFSCRCCPLFCSVMPVSQVVHFLTLFCTESLTSSEWLDVVLTVVHENEEWPESAGGHIAYLTYDEPLLTVCPARNSLSIVLRTVR